jgi:hypothetical protein
MVSTTLLPPDKKLVLELECWIALLEIWQGFPSSISSSATFPLNQQLPGTSYWHSAHHLGWNRNNATMDNQKGVVLACWLSHPEISNFRV